MAKHFLSALNSAIERRQKKGAPQSLASAAHLDRGLFSNVLSGKRDPSPAVVAKLAATLDSDDAHALIAAYLVDVAAAVREEARIRPGATDSAFRKIASALLKP